MSERRIVYILIFCTFAPWKVNSNQNKLPFSTKPIPPETPEPTDFPSEKAEILDEPGVLILAGGEGKEEVSWRNRGNLIYGTVRYTAETATGGILGNKTYVLFQINCYWTTCVGNLRAYSSVDGTGRCLEVEFVYYNTAYGEFLSAIQHRDGVFKLNIRINFGKDHNKKFDAFASMLREIRKPDTYSSTPLSAVLKWTREFPRNTLIFVFPGAYRNDVLPETADRALLQYCTTTAIVALNEHSLISKEQFSAFLDIMDSKGQNMTRFIAEQFPFGDRPAVIISDIVQTVDPNKGYLLSQIHAG